MLSDRPHPDAPDPAATPTAAAGASPTCHARAALADEAGFTLIELLVAMVTGLVVCCAAYGILIVTTDQSAHLTDYAQASQQGRIAMTKIVDELHSSCISSGFAPIQTGSSASELRFVNGYSEEAVISKTQVDEHRIVWNEKAATLIDYTYPATKEVSWPKFEYAAAASPAGGVAIAHNVTQTETGGKKIPVFQYYSYTSKSSEGATEGLSQLSTKPLEVPLEEKTAPTAASVLITFTTGPSDGTTPTGALGKGVTDGLQTQVTLSFSVPVSNNEVVDAPCK